MYLYFCFLCRISKNYKHIHDYIRILKLISTFSVIKSNYVFFLIKFFAHLYLVIQILFLPAVSALNYFNLSRSLCVYVNCLCCYCSFKNENKGSWTDCKYSMVPCFTISNISGYWYSSSTAWCIVQHHFTDWSVFSGSKWTWFGYGIESFNIHKTKVYSG